jgi:hypothetical protein
LWNERTRRWKWGVLWVSMVIVSMIFKRLASKSMWIRSISSSLTTSKKTLWVIFSRSLCESSCMHDG